MVTALVDTGAAVSVVSADLAEAVSPQAKYALSAGPVLVANGMRAGVKGPVILTVGYCGHTVQHPFVIMEGTPRKLLLGWDFLARQRWRIDGASSTILTPVGSLPLTNGVAAVLELSCESTETQHLQLGVDLTDAQRRAIYAAVPMTVFATKERPLGVISCKGHAIDTGASNAIRSALRRMSPKEREIEGQEVEKMLAMGSYVLRDLHGRREWCLSQRRTAAPGFVWTIEDLTTSP